jgi:hypothetical protein
MQGILLDHAPFGAQNATGTQIGPERRADSIGRRNTS